MDAAKVGYGVIGAVLRGGERLVGQWDVPQAPPPLVYHTINNTQRWPYKADHRGGLSSAEVSDCATPRSRLACTLTFPVSGGIQRSQKKEHFPLGDKLDRQQAFLVRKVAELKRTVQSRTRSAKRKNNAASETTYRAVPQQFPHCGFCGT